ncbi:helix-turn-helix transcriptional regulator [Saprospira sp. CCB-QB6]|uniref:AraC family transcriptional regulator n=1 Tax=Saprospira sp. CCB-QB6 TaxID=3023936 RepID=UPI00234A99E8|nr:helix-turn-helix transcriptional regulator [Saprospira sp. CCB-QB6]WCL81361.1 helix-turn-helix transcriptional regulator [Saprospira sp. CCB-QB6]
MQLMKFNKTACGVDFMLNVLNEEQLAALHPYFFAQPHRGDCFEILFFERAQGTLYLGDQQIVLQDNCLVFISAFQLRRWEIQAEELKFKVLFFKEEFLHEFFADQLFTYKLLYFYQREQPLYLPLAAGALEPLFFFLEEIKKELLHPLTNSAHIIRSLIYYLLERINRDYAVHYQLAFTTEGKQLAYEFKRLLELHIREKQRVEDYAQLLGLSRISLNKLAKTTFGQTASALIKQRLLAEIKLELIYHPEKSLSEIAYALGYSEPNHLMRFFKAQTGQKSSDFLAAYQNGSLSS